MISNLIFNEKSIPFTCVADVDTFFPQFLEIIKCANNEGIKAIKVNDVLGTGWYETNLSQTLNVREWLKSKDKEYELRIKVLIDKTVSPIIIKEDIDTIALLADSCFTCDDKVVDSLGCAFILKQMAISYASLPVWSGKVIQLTHETYTDDEEETEFKTIDVLNCSTLEHWNYHLPVIKALKKEYLEKGTTLLSNFSQEFEYLILCGKASSLKHIEYFDEFYEVLQHLNNYCKIDERDFSLESIKAITSLDIASESHSVDTNPKYKSRRRFNIDGVKYYFTFHVKNFPNNYRLHFYPMNDKIYIGYYGKHLPTKKFPK